MIWDLFSKRARRQRGEVPEVYQYDDIPTPVRIQIIQIWDELLLSPNQGPQQDVAFEDVQKLLLREYGKFQLTDNRLATPYEDVANFFLAETNVELLLDVIEVSFAVIGYWRENWHYRFGQPPRTPVEAGLLETNERLKAAAVGYQLEHGKIVRVDSTFVHDSVVKPALVVLSDPTYENAEAEFLNAHEHYRHGRYAECLVDALKSFESTLKVICDTKGWDAGKNPTANRLLSTVLEAGLLPDFMEGALSGLRSSLQSGAPTIRNRLGGHGQGAETREVPRHVAAYQLHLTSASIVLFAAAASRDA